MMGERVGGKTRGLRGVTIELRELLVGHGDCAAFTADRRTQLVPSPAAEETRPRVEPRLGFGESSLSGVASFERCQPLLIEQPEPRAVALAQLRPFDLCTRLVPRTDR